MNIGRLAARAVIGGLFVGHGTQKLFGWFGGPGIAGTEQMMDAIDMRPTRANAYAAGVAETAGGALLALGAGTPLAAAALTGTMATAIRKVHKPNGPWAAQGGWEYNAVLIAAIAALVEAGPGKISVDSRLGHAEWGAGWAFGAVAAGLAASAASVALGGRQAPTIPTQPTGPIAQATEGDTAGDPVTVVD